MVSARFLGRRYGDSNNLRVAEYFGMDRTAVLYVFDNPRRREHILLTDVEKDAKRERANQTARELAFGLALEFDARYRNKETI